MSLRDKTKLLVYLFSLSAIITALLLLLHKFFPDMVAGSAVSVLIPGFTLIALTALFIFFYGFNKDPEKSVMLTLITLGTKMLLSFIFALLYIVVLKNNDGASVVLFFVLYLVFTIFVITVFLNSLKKRELKNKAD